MDTFLCFVEGLARSYKWVILNNPGCAVVSDEICGDVCVVKSKEDIKTLVKAIAYSISHGRRLVIDVQNPGLFENVMEKFGSNQYPGRVALVKV